MVVKTDMILYYSDFEHLTNRGSKYWYDFILVILNMWQTVVVKTDMILYYSDFERLTNRGSKDWYDFILQWFWTSNKPW